MHAFLSVSLVACFAVLSAFSTYVLLAPSKTVSSILDIIGLTTDFKFVLLGIVIANIGLCVMFERYAEKPLARMVGNLRKWWNGSRSGKSRRRAAHDGKIYKTIEGNL